MLTCVSFVVIKEYLRKLSCRWTDRQTEVINTFRLLLESVKNTDSFLYKKHMLTLVTTKNIVQVFFSPFAYILLFFNTGEQG